MVQENYSVSSHAEIMQIVRYFKDAYFEQNRLELTRKGFSSSKGGFFLGVGEIFSLPNNVDIGGKTYSLK